jgi:tagatose 6-phosphate kinase
MIHILSPTTPGELVTAVPRLAPGATHRATAQLWRPGGKPVNVARFCARMGVSVRLVAVADERGSKALQSDPDLLAAGSTIELFASGVPARTDIVIAEADGRGTVVNGTGPSTAPDVLNGALEHLVAPVTIGDFVVLAGSLPAGASTDLYARGIAAARASGGQVVVDLSGPWLREALSARPDVLKLTVDELAQAVDARPATAWAEGPRLVTGVRSLIVTAGSRGARLWTRGRRWTVTPPTLVPINPTGAGDAVTAGLVSALAAGASLEDALLEAMAWGAAKVRELDFTLDPSIVAEVRGQVRSVTRAIAPG